MRVGLVRHFPVEEALPRGWRTSAELHAWQGNYNRSPARPREVDLGPQPWKACLSSDLARTAATAREIFAGEIEFTPLLREVEFAPFQTGGLRLPVIVWRWLLRWAWMTGHRSQRALRDDFRRRVAASAELVERRAANAGTLLVVSHAGMMAYLSLELRRRGFSGPKLRIAQHATLYMYERVEAPLRGGSFPPISVALEPTPTATNPETRS